MVDTTRLGGRIGSRVAGLVAEATPIVRRKTAKITHDTFMAAQHSFFALMSGEIRATLGKAVAEVADHPDTPESMKPMLRFLSRGSGQWQSFLAQSVAGSALGASLGGLFNNALARPIGGIIARFPNGFPSVGDLAQQVARRHRGFADTEFGARAQGVRTEDFARNVRQAMREMAPGDVLAALNRGVIDHREAARSMRDAGMTETAIGHTLSLRRQLISAQEAATLENFGVIDRGQGRNIANSNGMSDTDYDKLALGGGQAPGIEFLLAAHRRGFISDTRLARGIVQSPIRREWFDVIRDMRFNPPPTEAALSAATQNLLSPGAAKRIWTQNGFDPSGFEWALESNGRPLGIEQAAELFNRGLLSKGAAKQMFLESNVKNKYVDLIFPLFERVPPMEQTIRLVREGVLTPAEGVRGLRDLGFNPKRAGQLVDLALAEKNAPDRNLSITTVQELYEAQILPRAQARKQIMDIGFTAEEADWQLSIRDMRRERRKLDGAISRVRARFVAGKIDQREAENALDRLTVPAAARDDMIDTWVIEREISRPELTTAQTQAAMRAGMLSPDEGFARFTSRGYDEEDAGILVALAAPRAGR